MSQDVYEYPLMPEWDISAVILATDFYQAVEQFYDSGIERADFLSKYQLFRELEPAKMIQKQLDQRFQAVSGYSIYQAVQYANQHETKFIGFKPKKG
ncbi:hypothetical protein LPAF129_00030 [Ligilactobacillus pabuli]|uniref:Uncharacterized protein n=1 Tax=Ligilactobacillus pabuli TaxID=2886039 RepID=A0ABQ5JE21_9LACO|nr:UPF0223 family protein [Ligilactobacillus pabuli]GKS80318.1 hypothetical protein LPAF129_00030 [Ligilactobacillus pabuli]HIW89852.1 UPF0223 family protein [Candidatus Ligilactobacillus excrementipullorum]